MLRLTNTLNLYVVKTNKDIEKYPLECGSLIRTVLGNDHKGTVRVQVMAGKYEGISGGLLKQDCTGNNLEVI